MLSDYSQKLGEKLLQGWTLLDRSCPNTLNEYCVGVPLMRPRNDTRLFCVCCLSYYIEEGSRLALEPEVREQLPASATKADSKIRGVLRDTAELLADLIASEVSSFRSGSNSASVLSIHQKIALLKDTAKTLALLPKDA